MDKISQISLENTVTVKVDCLLNQQVLIKNFKIIMDCLRDLKKEQDIHSGSLKDLQNLRQTIKKLSESHQKLLSESNNKNSIANKGDSTNNSHQNDNKKGSQSDISKIMKEIQELKNKFNKHDSSINQNTKDVNVLLKDMIQAKDQIQNLKKLLNDKSRNKSNNSNNNGLQLGKNDHLNIQSIKNLNGDANQTKNSLKKLEGDIQNMTKHMQKLGKQLQQLKNQRNQNISNNNGNNENNKQSDQNGSNTNSGVDLNNLLKGMQGLKKKLEQTSLLTQQNNRSIKSLFQQSQSTASQLAQSNQNIDQINKQLHRINKILELDGLQMLNNQGKINLVQEMERVKEEIKKMYKIIEDLNHKAGLNNSQSAKNTNDKSFRRRADSVHKDDLNAKVSQLNTRLTYLQKLFNSKSTEENPQKLPSIKRIKKQMNTTGFNNNNEKSHKKQLNDIKAELELWIKNYLMNNQKDNKDLQFKLQQIKSTLLKKADHQGMKKGLAFLQGKITQLYLFLTQPDAQDAMIVRKGFNCLSCSKKVQTLRGKLGPRMNWDHLNNTNYNNHTPPKSGYPKYNESGQKDNN